MRTFDDFFKAELPRLEGVALALTGRRVLAEELAQEAMLVVYRRWDKLGRYDNPAAFARRVVANKSVSAFRRTMAEARAVNRVRGRRELPPAAVEAADTELWRAVRALPPRQAQAVALRYVADMDTAEIASVLECPDATVRVLLHRARLTLADKLGRVEVDEEVQEA